MNSKSIYILGYIFLYILSLNIVYSIKDDSSSSSSSPTESKPPKHLYAFTGQLADEFVMIDLSTGNITIQNANNPFYIFGVAKTTNTSMLLLSADFQKQDDALIQYDYEQNSFTSIGHIKTELFASIVNQPMGFDAQTLQVLACGQTKDSYNVTVFLWDFINNTGIVYPIPQPLVYPFPVGGIDAHGQTYYVLYGHAGGMMLSSILYTEPGEMDGGSTLFEGLRLMTPGVIVYDGQVYFIDTTFYYYDIYFVDIDNAVAKKMIRINNSFDKMTNVFPYSVSNEYVVLVTSAMNNQITYTIVNLITLETTNVSSNQQVNKRSNYVGVY